MATAHRGHKRQVRRRRDAAHAGAQAAGVPIPRPATSRGLATAGFVTHNVRGIRKSADLVSKWFSHFRARDHAGAAAIAFIQETHAEAADIPKLVDLHARGWGYNASLQPGNGSLWSSCSRRSGGVAMLRNPHAVVTALTPVQQSRWTAHWTAATTLVHGESLLLINLYAPTDHASREPLFKILTEVVLVHDGPALVGGGFNCTIHPGADRPYDRAAAAHYSPALGRMTEQWRWEDVLLHEMV
ncbi:hypothetical protein PybrP1_006187 [[Pythium] brassicae (nom. inval.)]|nr:hypothetical protein PybrP1_006187 [[Pythium] brassicae (nom. inval.)]